MHTKRQTGSSAKTNNTTEFSTIYLKIPQIYSSTSGQF